MTKVLRGGVNDDLFDRWTFGHAAAGAALGFLGVGALPTLGVAVGWEIAEIPLKNHLPSVFPYSSQDSIQNMVGDVIGYMIGWGLATGIKLALR